MLDRVTRGEIPDKPHTVFRDEAGGSAGPMLYEECLTRQGFDGPFSILYHRHRPHEAVPSQDASPDGTPAPMVPRFPVPPPGDPALRSSGAPALLRRHYRCLSLPAPAAASPLAGRTPLLFNRHTVIGFLQPSAPDPAYFSNADGDDLFFILHGAGTLRSVFGDLRFTAGDYVAVPKGTLHRFLPDAGVPQAWLSIECKSGDGTAAGRTGLALPAHYRNAVGQLRMDAPYGHRDFRRPELTGPLDEGIRDLVVKRGDSFQSLRFAHPPLDVVGWDGTVYPFVFPILSFSPRVGQIHLPPLVHATFDTGSALICSFVPRPLDFHPQANPCPYPHSSVDVDEVLFYANGAFGSRRGVGPGSLSHHPAGIPHGPHPGAYESAPGQTRTEELAVMLDCLAPLWPTDDARSVEDPEYHRSFVGGR